MNKFNTSRRSGGGGGSERFGRRPGTPQRPGGGFEKREMFRATCAKCGKTCEVPFRPSPQRPVYCRECFGAPGNGSNPPAPMRPSAPSFKPPVSEDRRIDEIKRQLEAMNAKLDSIFQMVVAPEIKSEIPLPAMPTPPRKTSAGPKKKRVVRKK